jgi:hypothetical protein
MERHQRPRFQFIDIRESGLFRITVGDLVDATARPVHAVAFVAFTGIAPVDNKDSAVRTVAEIEPDKPGVGGK